MKIAIFEANYHYKNTTHTSMGDWYRSLGPARYLRQTTDWTIETFKNPFQGNSKFKNWNELTAYFDIVYFPFYANYHLCFYLLNQTRKSNLKVIVDVDDNVWDLTHRDLNYHICHLGTRIYHIYYQIVKAAPFLTTTNTFLKKRLMQISTSKQISILPNYVDLENIYSYVKTEKTRENNFLNIVFFGSRSHQADIDSPFFTKILIQTARDHSNVMIKTIGIKSDILRKAIPRQYKLVKGVRDIYKWSKLWQDEICSADIVVAPLQSSSFSRCKSPIKFFESASAKLPFICNNTSPYQEVIEHAKTGFLCRTENDWYHVLEALIKNKELRIKIGNNAYDYVKDNCTIQKNIWRYKEFFEKVYNTKILHN